MNDYLQPDFYRFNQDSLTLVNFITKKVASADSILDLGAGCGVIGIELANFYKPGELTLVEGQTAFLSFLNENLKTQLTSPIMTQVLIDTFGHFMPKRLYQLIVSNPPYYLAGHGQPSKDAGREMARAFVKDGWHELYRCVDVSLSSEGEAYIVVKKNKVILDEAENLVPKALKLIIHEMSDIVVLELSRLDK